MLLSYSSHCIQLPPQLGTVQNKVWDLWAASGGFCGCIAHCKGFIRKYYVCSIELPYYIYMHIEFTVFLVSLHDSGRFLLSLLFLHSDECHADSAKANSMCMYYVQYGQ